jgi:hypothetical protein
MGDEALLANAALAIRKQNALARRTDILNARRGLAQNYEFGVDIEPEFAPQAEFAGFDYGNIYGFGPANGRYGEGLSLEEKVERKKKVQEAYRKRFDAGKASGNAGEIKGQYGFPVGISGTSSLDDWHSRGGVQGVDGAMHKGIFYSLQAGEVRRGLKRFKEWARANGATQGRLTRHPIYRYLKALAALTTAASMVTKFGKKSVEDRTFTLTQHPTTQKQFYRVVGNQVRSTLEKMKKYDPAKAKQGVEAMFKQAQKIENYRILNQSIYENVRAGQTVNIPALINQKRAIADKEPLPMNMLTQAVARQKAGAYLVEPVFNNDQGLNL